MTEKEMNIAVLSQGLLSGIVARTHQKNSLGFWSFHI